MFSVPITENVGDPRARDFCERGRERFGFCLPSSQGILQEEGTRQELLAGTCCHRQMGATDARTAVVACTEILAGLGDKFHPRDQQLTGAACLGADFCTCRNEPAGPCHRASPERVLMCV